MDRNHSFSVSPMDTTGLENITKLRKYSETKGVSFSFLVLKGIAKVVKELKL